MENAKKMFGKEVRIMPVEWNPTGSYYVPVALVLQRAILRKEIKSIERFYNSFQKAFQKIMPIPLDEMNAPKTYNVVEFKKAELNSVFPSNFLQECEEINLIEHKSKGGKEWIYVNSYSDLRVPDDFFKYDNEELRIKEKYEEFLKNLSNYTKQIEDGLASNDEGMHTFEVIFSPFLFEMMKHPTIFSKLDEQLQERIQEMRERLAEYDEEEEDNIELLEEITEIIQEFAKDPNTFDFWF